MEIDWGGLEAALTRDGLFVMGALHDGPDTVILIGAAPPMWDVFKDSAEFNDGAPDPLDRWSKRRLGALCAPHKATAVFPSDGPPYLPFIAWAEATGRFWQSPTGMLVHDTAGLMISIRGALRIPGHAALPVPPHENPCGVCVDQPCATACPVDALTATTAYDVPACRVHLRAPHGAACMGGGCLARRVCPVSDAFGRDPAQSAFHMAAFMPD